MSKTPYELRFEIFKQAYAMLSDNYHVDFAKAECSNGGTLPEGFDSKYPTLDDVLKQAQVINDFVSDNK
jgi:hypothetical protein